MEPTAKDIEFIWQVHIGLSLGASKSLTDKTLDFASARSNLRATPVTAIGNLASLSANRFDLLSQIWPHQRFERLQGRGRAEKILHKRHANQLFDFFGTGFQ